MAAVWVVFENAGPLGRCFSTDVRARVQNVPQFSGIKARNLNFSSTASASSPTPYTNEPGQFETILVDRFDIKKPIKAQSRISYS